MSIPADARYVCLEHGWVSNLIPCPDDRHKAGTEQGESSDEQ
jgi:hypothetical protein